mgnify:CR=1 FL=1
MPINKLNNFVNFSKPSIIFHLAAQSLIYESYNKPLLTFDVNCRGTLNVLEVTKKSKFVKSKSLTNENLTLTNSDKLEL